MSWARHFDRCIDCGRDDRRHKARGRCVVCDTSFRYHTQPEFAAKMKVRAKKHSLANADRKAARARSWYLANPERALAKQREYRHRRYRTVRIEIAGQWLDGFVVAYRHEDGEKVADVKMPSGRVITFPRGALYREAAP